MFSIKKGIKIRLLSILTVITLTGGTCFAGITEMNGYTDNLKKVTIIGHTQEQGKNVTLVVSEFGVSQEMIENDMGRLVHIQQTKSGSDCSFQFVFNLNTTPNSKYQAYLSTEGMTGVDNGVILEFIGITITDISDINEIIFLNQNYRVPTTVSAKTDTGDYVEVPVVWTWSNGTVPDGKTAGVYSAFGTVAGYPHSVLYTLKVRSTEEPDIKIYEDNIEYEASVVGNILYYNGKVLSGDKSRTITFVIYNSQADSYDLQRNEIVHFYQQKTISDGVFKGAININPKLLNGDVYILRIAGNGINAYEKDITIFSSDRQNSAISAINTAIGNGILMSEAISSHSEILNLQEYVNSPLFDDYCEYFAKNTKTTFGNINSIYWFFLKCKEMVDINNTLIQSFNSVVKTNNWGELEKMLTVDYMGFLGIDLTKYKKVRDKKAVFVSMLRNECFDTDGILTLFYTSVDKQFEVEAEKFGSKAGGSGGISNASLSISVASNTLQVNEQQAMPFLDIGHTTWANGAIKYLADRKILSGDGMGRFYPDNPISKEELAKIVYISFGYNDSGYKPSFEDIDENTWYYPYVCSLSGAGIIKGINEREFGTGGLITREQLAVMLYRAAVKAGFVFEINQTPTFADYSSVSEYALEAVSVLNSAGILIGTPDNRLMPQEFTTRAQCAKLIYELLKYIGK